MNTYLPHGLETIPVIYFKWQFNVCYTMLSNWELNTFIVPSYVPATTADTFHWLVKYYSLVIRKPIVKTFWPWSFSVLNYLTTDLFNYVPAAKIDFEFFSKTTEEYLLLFWFHFLHAQSLESFVSLTFHYATVPSIPTEYRYLSSNFQLRSVMTFEWSLNLAISYKV